MVMLMRSLPEKTLIIASHNQGKLREFTDLMAGFGVAVRGAGELGLIEPEETGTTFEQNALIKAQAAAKVTNRVALADDSGLCIEALGGAPGVYTADWAIQADGSRDFGLAMARVERELRALGALQPAARKARFVCVLCLAWPDGQARYFRGEVEGHIHSSPLGNGGFGYDPIFIPQGFDKTFAQMSGEEKQRGHDGAPLSHRARALKLFTQAFFEKVDTGFSQKNAIKQDIRAVDCVNQEKKRSDAFLDA